VLAAAGATAVGAAGQRPSGQVVIASQQPPQEDAAAAGGEGEEEAGVTPALKPFTTMLQFLLEPLLLAGAPGVGAGGGGRGHHGPGGAGRGLSKQQQQGQRAEEAASQLPTLLKVLRAIKSTQVAQVRLSSPVPVVLKAFLGPCFWSQR
jgi:hypothetical protein